MSSSENSAPFKDKFLYPVLWSLLEVFFTLVVSNFAILVGIFVYKLINSDTSDVWDVFMLHLNKLQYKDLIVFIFGIAAPSIWILIRNKRLWRHNKFCGLLFGLQCVVVMSVGLVYSLSLAEVVKNVDFAEYWASRCFYISVFMWFVTLSYQKIVIDKSSDGISTPNNAGQSAKSIVDSLRSRA